MVEEEGREAALQTVTPFVEHLERIAEQASELEGSHFTPLLKRLEETWGVSYQPPSLAASVSEQEAEMGESTGFDEDSDDESEEEDDEVTKKGRAFIDDDDADDLEKEGDLSFYRQVNLQLPERQPVALPAAPVQPTNRLLEKGSDC